jgi:hypothetical protein
MRLDILSEPRGAAYTRLLHLGLEYCDEALVVVRSSLELSEGAAHFLERIRPSIISTQLSKQWPGTALLDEEATLYGFSYNDFSMRLLASVSQGLYEWQQPSLPEDLCLFARFQHRPWLVTIAHESDAYVDVTPEVADRVKCQLADMGVIIA